MTKVLIDVALIAIAWLAGTSLLSSGRKFVDLFAQLRAEMAAGMPTQTMMVTTRSTMADTAALVYRPQLDVAGNTAGTLPVTSLCRRPAGLRAAA